MTSFQLRPIDRSRLSSSIADQILDGVRSGAYVPGAPLPAERELADQLGVSRGSVREAVRVLEFAGVLEVRSGSGTYVTEDALSNTTTLRVAAASAGDHSPLDVIVARRAVEPLCARLAAERRHEHDLKEIRAAYEEQHAHVHAGTDPTDADIAFHKLIAHASHNTALSALVDQIMGIMSQQMWRDIKHDSLMRPGRPELYIDEHRAILDAIANGEPEQAADAMDAHLAAVEQGLLDVVT